MKNIFEGKEKAWASAIAMFLVSIVLQRTGQGTGPTPDDIQTVVSIASEIGISVVSAAVAYFSTWLTANTGTPDVIGMPVEPIPSVGVVDSPDTAHVTNVRVIEENPS